MLVRVDKLVKIVGSKLVSQLTRPEPLAGDWKWPDKEFLVFSRLLWGAEPWPLSTGFVSECWPLGTIFVTKCHCLVFSPPSPNNIVLETLSLKYTETH